MININNYDEYFESSNIPVMRARTDLYGLTPYSIGTGKTESLISYIERLADAHRVTPSTLVNRVIAKLLEKRSYKGDKVDIYTKRFIKYYSYRIYHFDPFRFYTSSTMEFAEIISKATGINNLYKCSPLVLGKNDSFILNPSYRLRSARYFCPICVYEGNKSGNCYRQLLWDFFFVNACPIHKVRLVNESCGAPESKHLDHPNRKYYPGICHSCGSINYKCQDIIIENALKTELDLSVNIHDILSKASRTGKEDLWPHINHYNNPRYEPIFLQI